VAEASELIVELGYEVLQMAVAQLKRWRDNERTRRLSISVNISAKHFEQHDFVGRVAEIIADSGLHPGTLKLEITESALAQDLNTISARMDALRGLGIAFSLDDFGTGYSSLTYLKRLPIAQVKIDQSFVRDLLVDENDRGITETIIALANTLKMDTVAEGVETEDQRTLLRQLGCPVFQGFLFDRPAPLDELCRRYALPADPVAEG
jgi:EAL domain-containing protein (putative c-di-GMP-specific phosphodiesterase class I)